MTSDNKIEDIDRQYVWHPFTQMREWENEVPLIIEKGEGNWLIDTHGRRYLDGISSLWVTVHGHRKKEIDDAVRAQLDLIAHSTLLGLSNVPATLLAEKLVGIAPKGLTRVFYSDSGSTAVEIALKIAFQYWQQKGGGSKTKFLTFKNAYHGDTIGSVSVGGIDLFHSIYHPLLFDAIKATPETAEELIIEHQNQLAAVIIEPLVQGASGMLLHPPGFLKRLRKICSESNVLLICDEVATGFGRTGKMFACEHEGVTPDLMCVAKGITGGYLPLAATLATAEIYDAFQGEYAEFKTFFHGHTYTGNPLACAAALANLEIFKKEKTIENLSSTIPHLSAHLESLKTHPNVLSVRQCGMMAGIELGRSGKPYAVEDRMGHKVCMDLRKRGVILRPLGNVVVVMPPLSIMGEEMDFIFQKMQESIKEVCGM